ncbi:MAG: nitrite reductase/ring-hydroxylating ferredoxin subunit [Halioglobus sp.]|jgi:nitrite reductase/ring-hydroxylating ferredoxin subunit
MSETEFRRVAQIDELPPGKILCVEVDGHEVLLCHTKEGIFAVDNMCTHAAARLCEGKLKGHRILCPLHGAAFDVRDGSALTRPASIALTSHKVEATKEGIGLLLNAAGDDQ